jgi:beta-xylosidase
LRRENHAQNVKIARLRGFLCRPGSAANYNPGVMRTGFFFSVFTALVCLSRAATPVSTEPADARPAQTTNATDNEKLRSGNPVFPGWYADPEVAIFQNQYWIYPTYSAPYNAQVFFDAFSSPDLVHWTRHSRVLDTNRVTWAHRAMWAPALAERNGKYFFFFGANDIHDEQKEIGGIGVAMADKPEGPFHDLLGKPLVREIRNGAQPIDQFVFRDEDGRDYLIYGGWSHCNIARLKPDFTGLQPFADGSTFKEITPEHYVEGPCMFRKDGKYYFMWSEGGWTGPNYSVAYAIGTSPSGPFKHRQGIEAGPGHRYWGRPPFDSTRAEGGPMVHRVSPKASGRNGCEPSCHLYRRDAL